MGLIDQLTNLASRAQKQLVHIQTEEATKTALVMPFINAPATTYSTRQK